MPVLIFSLIFASACGFFGISDDCADSGNSGDGNYAGGREEQANQEQADQTDEKGEPDSIMEKIAEMTIEEKIGQMVIVGLGGHTIDENSRHMVEDYHAGGFILFKRNIRDAAQTLSLINSLRALNAANGIPLFISVDEEGGRVSRLPGELGRLPSAKTIGDLGDGNVAFDFGSVTAKVLKALGFNTNFAPVLDIYSNPDNQVIGDRAFGTKPGPVARLGVEVMKGIRSQGMISVVKHFPGHGDTAEDSHVGLPVVESDMERLKSFELQPFFSAVESKADAIMVAHILFPKIDRDNPASLSRVFITDILRGEMGFDGVVITDDMTMGAIAENYDIGEAAVKSINAGSDIILVCHDYSKQVAVIEALLQAARNGTISEETVNSSVYRILKLKEKYGLSDEQTAPADVGYINELIKNINKRVSRGQ